LEKFAESFIKYNSESILEDFTQDQRNTLKDFEIIQQFFLGEKKRYDKFIKAATGFVGVNLTPNVFSSLNAISKISGLGQILSPALSSF
jgi:hypothetical protein